MESIQEHPQQPEKILIGYSRGLVILWSLSTRQVEERFLGKQVAILYFFVVAKYFNVTKGLFIYFYFLLKLVNLVWEVYLLFFLFLYVSVQQLESLVWERSGNLFVSSHNDGGYCVWTVTSGNGCSHQPSTTIPYGEKCKHACLL